LTTTIFLSCPSTPFSTQGPTCHKTPARVPAPPPSNSALGASLPPLLLLDVSTNARGSGSGRGRGLRGSGRKRQRGRGSVGEAAWERQRGRGSATVTATPKKNHRLPFQRSSHPHVPPASCLQESSTRGPAHPRGAGGAEEECFLRLFKLGRQLRQASTTTTTTTTTTKASSLRVLRTKPSTATLTDCRRLARAAAAAAGNGAAGYSCCEGERGREIGRAKRPTPPFQRTFRLTATPCAQPPCLPPACVVCQGTNEHGQGHYACHPRAFLVRVDAFSRSPPFSLTTTRIWRAGQTP